jgi:hypothetical protein
MPKEDWRALIKIYAGLTDWPDEFCTNMVIGQFLLEGDFEPLRHMLAAGFQPDATILRHLGKMLDPKGNTPFRLEIKKRGGRPGPKIKETRNLVRTLRLATQMKSLKDKGYGYKEAKAFVAKNNGCSESTVRDACEQFEDDFPQHLIGRIIRGEYS